MPNRLVANRPSLNNSDLRELATARKTKCRALTQASPNISIVIIELEDALEILNSLVELLLCAEDAADRIHGGNGSRVGTQCVFIRSRSFVQVSQKLCKAPCVVVSVKLL